MLCPFVSVFFVYPPALHALFTSYKKSWKRSLLAISRSWDASAEIRLASKVAQLRQIASKLRFHNLVQEVKCAWSAGGYTKNTLKKGHKTSQRCLETVPRDVVQMRQIAIKVKVSHRCFFVVDDIAQNLHHKRVRIHCYLSRLLHFSNTWNNMTEKATVQRVREIPNKRRPATRLTGTGREGRCAASAWNSEQHACSVTKRETSSLLQVREIASKTCMHAFKKTRKLHFHM